MGHDPTDTWVVVGGAFVGVRLGVIRITVVCVEIAVIVVVFWGVEMEVDVELLVGDWVVVGEIGLSSEIGSFLKTGSFEVGVARV